MPEVIVALDLPTPEAALKLVEALPDLKWVKVGPVLFVRGGPRLVGRLRDRGLSVFLDLKWHDIPNTVAEAARAAGELGVDLATVHALGGKPMMRAAVEAAGPLRIAAVAVLTSHTPADYWEATCGPGGGSLDAEVERLVRSAVESGVGAVVASPLEAARIAPIAGAGRWVVTPGIRPAGSPTDDQRRTATPAQAVAAGATHLVVGRPITRAESPRAVYDAVCEEIA